MELKDTLDKLNKELKNEGYKGTRGVPDGSGPGPGLAGKGRRKGNCPKREDYKTDEEYEKALKDWKKKNV